MKTIHDHALSLIKLGFNEYWDEIDRVSRNQVVETKSYQANFISGKTIRG